MEYFGTIGSHANDDVASCKQILLKFVSDWQNAPTLWLQEIDVQVDLADRLQQHFDRQARGHFLGTFFSTA